MGSYHFTRPYTTPVLDEIIDKACRNLPGSEYKLLTIITRQTLGYRKLWDYMSLSQLTDKTGLSKQAVLDARSALKQKRWIRYIKKGGRYYYSLKLNRRVVKKLDMLVFRGSLKIRPPWSKKLTFSVVQKVDTQETINKDLETIKETVVASPSPSQLQNFYLWQRLNGTESALNALKREYGNDLDDDVIEWLIDHGYENYLKITPIVSEDRGLYVVALT